MTRPSKGAYPTVPPIESAPYMPTVSQAALTKAVMDSWKLTALGKGHHVVVDGKEKPQMAHLVFSDDKAAGHFARYHGLTATGTHRGFDRDTRRPRLKTAGTHENYPGQSVLRLSRDQYEAVAARYKLPTFDALLVSTKDNIAKQPHKIDQTPVELGEARRQLAGAMNLSFVARGVAYEGFVQMVFNTKYDASRFVHNYGLDKENKGHMIDTCRYAGLYTVRMRVDGTNLAKVRSLQGELMVSVDEMAHAPVVHRR